MKNIILILILISSFACSPDPQDDNKPDGKKSNDEPLIHTKFTTIDTGTNQSFVLRNKSLYTFNPFNAYAAETCLELGVVDSDTYTAIETENPGVCFDTWKVINNNFVWFSYHIIDADPIIYYFAMKNPAGNIHYFDHPPSQGNGFANAFDVQIINNKAMYIYDGNVIEKHLVTGAETTKFVGNIRRFYEINKANGRNFLTIGDVVIMNKADGSSVEIQGLAGKDAFPNTDGLMYSDDRAKYASIDDNGDIVTGLRSNPVAFQAWIDGGGVGGVPLEMAAIGTSGVMKGKYLISGKIYKIGGVGEDLKTLDLIPYGHPNIDSWSNVRACVSNDNLYFYGQHPDFEGYRLTYINEPIPGFRDILTTHQVTQIACSDSNVVLACGINLINQSYETIRITDANLVGFNVVITSGCDVIAQGN